MSEDEELLALARQAKSQAAAPPPDDAALLALAQHARANAPQEPGFWNSAGRGGLQGATFGFGDEVAGLMTSGMQGAVNLLPKSAQDYLDVVPASAGDAYRYSRDLERERNAAAEKAHRWAYLGGNVAGGALTGRFLPSAQVAEGANLAARAGAGILSGIPAGLAYGAGASNAELTGPGPANWQQLALDTGVGGLAGGVVGGVAPVLGAGIKAAPGVVKAGGRAVGRFALGADDASMAAMEQAMKDRAVEYLGTAKGAAQRLGTAVSEKYGPAAARVKSALVARGVEGPEATELGDRLLQRSLKEQAASLDSPVPGMWERAAYEASEKGGESGRIGLENSLEMLGKLQDRANYNPAIEKVANQARKAIAYETRDSIENAVRQQTRGGDAELRALGEQFPPTRRALANALSVQEAAETAAKRSHTLKDLAVELGAGMAGHGAFGHGPLGVLAGPATAAGTFLARTRGPQTLARGLYDLGSIPGWIADTPYAQALGNALRPAAAAVGRQLAPGGAYGAAGGYGERFLPELPPWMAPAFTGNPQLNDALALQAAQAEAIRQQQQRRD